jgi:DNA-binding HxlR family transcriptional regulator
MATKRTYGDRCGIARALDLVGERWALLIVRELLLGPKRFTDLRAGLPNLGPDILSQRLRELEAVGVVRRTKLPPPAGSRVYELTEWGRDLEPVVLQLGRWGSRAPVPAGEPPLGADSAVLALKTLFDPAAAGDVEARYELRLGEHRFRARVTGGRLELARGAAEHPDATIETDPATLAAVLWHGRAMTEAERAGDMTIDGSRPAIDRFVGLFPLADPVTPASGTRKEPR